MTPLAAGAPPEHEDPIARHLFPPEKVLAHQMEIGLDDAQRRGGAPPFRTEIGYPVA